MKMQRLLALLGAVLVVLMPTAALSHGEAITTDPAAGERLGDAPSAVTIEFSEPPTSDSKFAVVDGCDNDVLAQVAGGDTNKRLRVAGGSPGKWTVTFNVISATDGHQTHDRFTFTVAGKPDCSGSTPAAGESPEIGDAGVPLESDDSSFPLAPVLIGGTVILVLAVAVRVLSSR